MGNFINACRLAGLAFNNRAVSTARRGRRVLHLDEFSCSTPAHNYIKFLAPRDFAKKVVVIDLDDVIFTIKRIPGIFRGEVYGFILTSFGMQEKLNQIRQRENGSAFFVLSTKAPEKRARACLKRAQIPVAIFDALFCGCKKAEALQETAKKFSVPRTDIVLIDDQKYDDLKLRGQVWIERPSSASGKILNHLMQDEFASKIPSDIISLPMALELAMCFFGNSITNHASVAHSLDGVSHSVSRRGLVLEDGAVIKPAAYPVGPTYTEALMQTFFRLKVRF